MSSLATKVLSRSFVTSARSYAKPGYFLHKLLDREEAVQKRASAMEKHAPKMATVLPSSGTRRQSVLNALYMETITDILGSEFATELEKHRIQIHNVRIMRNLDVIFVYWSCDESGLINPEAAEQLKELEPKIRRELSAVRHMGIIPCVRFVFYSGFVRNNAVHSILHRLRVAGELDKVEPAPLPLKEYPQVYGLDRNKILSILRARSLPADLMAPEAAVMADKLSGKTADGFLDQFRKAKAGSRKKDSVIGFKERLEVDRLLLEEFCANNREDHEDQYEDNDEEEYYDFDESLERPIDEDDYDR